MGTPHRPHTDLTPTPHRPHADPTLTQCHPRGTRTTPKNPPPTAFERAVKLCRQPLLLLNIIAAAAALLMAVLTLAQCVLYYLGGSFTTGAGLSSDICVHFTSITTVFSASHVLMATCFRAAQFGLQLGMRGPTLLLCCPPLTSVIVTWVVTGIILAFLTQMGGLYKCNPRTVLLAGESMD